MANIIEKQELPVIITKVKIGKKDLTKKIIDQLTTGLFVYHRNHNGRKVYGLPIKIDYVKDGRRTKTIAVFDTEDKYELDGTLIGYVKLPEKEVKNMRGDVLAYAEKLTEKYDNGTYEEHENFKGQFYFILWYTTDNKLKKGAIDRWTLDQLEIKLEQIFI